MRACLASLRAVVLGLAVFAAGLAHAQDVSVASGVVTFNGRIEEASAARFLAIVNAQSVTRLVIHSEGGIVLSALQMAEAVFRHGIDVEVPDTCRSSCANYVFPAGRRKFLGRPDAVAWHGNMTHVLYLDQSGQGRWSAQLMEGAYYLAALEADFYRRIGVDGFVTWFGKIPPYDVLDYYWLGIEDMERFGIRGVTMSSAAAGPRGGADLVRPDWVAMESRRPVVAVRRAVPDTVPLAPGDVPAAVRP
jgi:hypothetical protein